MKVNYTCLTLREHPRAKGHTGSHRARAARAPRRVSLRELSCVPGQTDKRVRPMVQRLKHTTHENRLRRRLSSISSVLLVVAVQPHSSPHSPRLSAFSTDRRSAPCHGFVVKVDRATLVHCWQNEIAEVHAGSSAVKSGACLPAAARRFRNTRRRANKVQRFPARQK